MKDRIMGFDQQLAHENGVSLNEICFLDWFFRWYSSGKMIGAYDGKHWYGWIDRGYVMEQLPILNLGHVNSVSRFVTGMVQKGLLIRMVRPNDGKRGTKTFVRPGPLADALRHIEDFHQTEAFDEDDQQTQALGEQADHLTVELAESGGPPNPRVSSNNLSKNNNLLGRDIYPDTGKPAPVDDDTRLSEFPEEDQELYHAMKESFLSKVTGGAFSNWPKESKGLKRLLRYSRTFAIDNRSEWSQALLESFWRLIDGRDRFWSNQPFLPSVLASDGIFPRVHKEMAEEFRRMEVAKLAKEHDWF